MPVLMAQELPAAVTRLPSNDAKRVWAFLAKFIENPAHPSLSLERIVQGKNDNLWSARISQGLRAILHKDGNIWTVLHADQHDAAYQWAETKQIARHPTTGALQIVESPEIMNAQSPTVLPETLMLFHEHKDDYLISLGLPPSWLPTIRRLRALDDLWVIVFKLPEDVAERLLKVAEGEIVTPPLPVGPEEPVTASQDTKRRFFVLEQNEDLLRMLEAPLETWVAFLHPSQQKLVTGMFNGPLKITGSAGTGKTVVAMHRARHLARQNKKVLLTSFVTTLCDNIERNLEVLCSSKEQENITVSTIHKQALALANTVGSPIHPIDQDELYKLIEQVYQPWTCPLDLPLLLSEWETVIQDQGITSWEEYRKVSRVGRGFPLSIKGRKQVWELFAQILTTLQAKGLMDWSGICRRARQLLTSATITSPFDAVIVDELQDLRPQEIMLVGALAGTHRNALTLVGDGGQRIYNGRISLKSLGVDVRGRSHVLRINYRTTEQIRCFADRLLQNQSDDMDGGQEQRTRTVSLLSGPEPITQGFTTQSEQIDWVIQCLQRLIREGLAANEIAIFARTNKFLEGLEKALKDVSLPTHNLRKDSINPSAINLGTMHRAKGLEFKAVLVVNLADDQVPLQSTVSRIQDEQLRQDALERERHLLYVSMTRARDEVFLTWVGQPSRFLEEILTGPETVSPSIGGLIR
jgi:superfamily I DNA/RNA helicase